MANKDVTLELNGVKVYPRTFTHNVYGDDGKTSLASVLSQMKGVQESNSTNIANHGVTLEQHASQILALQNADAALGNRISSLEETRTNHEGRIQTLEKNAGTLEGRVKANEDAIVAINKVIPTNANEENKLAAESYVNDAINQIGAYYITNSNGEAFATKAEFDAAVANGALYSGGELRTPQRNDYALVLSDESKLPADDADGNPTTRYIFDGEWEFQYIVNNTTFKQSQLDAINSGITAELVGKITANETAIGELTQTVTDNKSEIDGRLDSAEARLDAIDGEEGRLTTIESAAAELAKTVADNKTELDERIDDIINSNLGGLDQEIAEINSNIEALQKEINGVPADAEGNGAVVGIKERLTTAEGDIDALEGRAEAVEGRMDTAEADIDAAEGRLDVIEAAINGIPADENGEGKVAGIVERLDGHDTAIEELRTAIDEKQADLTAGQYVTITEDESGSQVIDIIVDSELSVDSTNPVSNNVITLELSKKVECSEEEEFDVNIDYVNMSERVSALEATIANLVAEINYLKSLHNGPVTPDEPEVETLAAPANVVVDDTTISFDEVPGATGYTLVPNKVK